MWQRSDILYSNWAGQDRAIADLCFHSTSFDRQRAWFRPLAVLQTTQQSISMASCYGQKAGRFNLLHYCKPGRRRFDVSHELKPPLAVIQAMPSSPLLSQVTFARARAVGENLLLAATFWKTAALRQARHCIRHWWRAHRRNKHMRQALRLLASRPAPMRTLATEPVQLINGLTGGNAHVTRPV